MRDVTVLRRKDILPRKEGEPIAVAVKHRGENKCYAFSNESYQFPDLEKPDWRLGQGSYKVEVTVRSEDQELSEVFVLENKGVELGDFNLTYPAER